MWNKNAVILRSALQGWVWRIIGMSLLLLSAYGWLRLFASLSQINALLDFGLYPAVPGYFQVSGAIIGCVALAAWFMLKFGHPAGLKTTSAVVVIFLVVYWIERFLLWKSTPLFGNWLFMLVLSIFWLILLWIGFRVINGQKIRK